LSPYSSSARCTRPARRAEQAQAASVIVVEMGQVDTSDVTEDQAVAGEGVLERLDLGVRQDRDDRVVAPVKALVERSVVDQRRVDPRVDQRPAVVRVEQDRRHRLDQDLTRAITVSE